jgi:predicted O-linked N-acetylglucosamine transferase (SPINDLY family)
MGLADWVAGDADAYRRLALERATDLTQLACLRGELRGRLTASTLCDGSRIAQDIVEIVSDLWARHCRKEGAASDTENGSPPRAA